MKPEKIFEIGLQYHHYANTAYPLTPNSFKNYKIKEHSEYISFLEKEWSKTDNLSLYVHIPFCKVRCKFCEYVVLESSDSFTEDSYISLLLKEMKMYKNIIKDKTISGYDLGGGTPTKLSVKNIQKITTAVTSLFNFDKNVVFSIETTPVIAAEEPEKIEAIYKMGYKRISMGVQTVSEKLLNELGREGATHIYEKAVSNIRRAGFTKFNIDLMYGFLNQNDEEFINTLKYAIALNPEYITLYRNRYKGTKLEEESGGVSLYKIIKQYRLAYNILIESGYNANIGKNTFSRAEGDYGTSDYLTKRVIYGTPYVGIGLGAQSLGIDYLAYNEGAATKQLEKYREKIENGFIPIQDIYSIDTEESIGKMVSVAFYFGFVDFDAFEKRFNISFKEHFKNEIEFLLKNELMEIKENRIYLTNRGSDYINGIIPLFYSERSKKELIELQEKNKTLKNGEEEFLKAYNFKEYDHLSLATDIVVLKKEKLKDNFSILMIKRGEHPFMNSWALPGGFIRKNESAEESALRELKEETGLTQEIFLEEIGVFSEPNRDPRGRIVSVAFLSVIDNENTELRFGEDAIDAKFFNIELTRKKMIQEDIEIEEIKLKIAVDDINLSAVIMKERVTEKNRVKEKYKIKDSFGIAFDHANIIVTGIDKYI